LIPIKIAEKTNFDKLFCLLHEIMLFPNKCLNNAISDQFDKCLHNDIDKIIEKQKTSKKIVDISYLVEVNSQMEPITIYKNGYKICEGLKLINANCINIIELFIAQFRNCINLLYTSIFFSKFIIK